MTEAHETPQNHISRRSIAKGAVWAAPVVIASQTAAFAATSCTDRSDKEDCCLIYEGCDPYFNDQKYVGNATSDVGDHEGNFQFIADRGTKFPEISWTVTIEPVLNDGGKLNKNKREFLIKDLQEGVVGSATPQSFDRNNVSGPTYDPASGKETITFTTPPTTANKGSKSLVGFRVWVGDLHTGQGWLSDTARADHVIITGVSNGRTVVRYDSLHHATKGPALREHQYDGRI